MECDVDYEEPAEAWLAQVLETLAGHAQTTPDENVIAFGAFPRKAVENRHDRRNPFHAEVLDSVLLSVRGSPGETHHFELSLEGSD